MEERPLAAGMIVGVPASLWHTSGRRARGGLRLRIKGSGRESSRALTCIKSGVDSEYDNGITWPSLQV